MKSKTAIINLLLSVVIIGGGIWIWYLKHPPIRPAHTIIDHRLPIPPEHNIIYLLTSLTKQDIMDDLKKGFAQKYPDCDLQIDYTESHKGLFDILDKVPVEKRPQMYSPSLADFATSLNEHAGNQVGGSTLFKEGYAKEDVLFAETPIVFLTTKEKAGGPEDSVHIRDQKLYDLLHSPAPWENIRQRLLNHKPMAWGSLRFSFANPDTSSSGLITLGMIWQDYQHLSSKSNLGDYFNEIAKGMIYDHPARAGSTDLFRQFISEIASKHASKYDFIVTYESNALRALHDNSNLNLRIIYPTQVTISKHRICVLRSSCHGAQYNLSSAFVEFVGHPDGQKIVQDNYMHPRNVEDRVLEKIRNAASYGFKIIEPRECIDPP